MRCFIQRLPNTIYEAKHWVIGEGAIYTIPAGVTVKAVQYRETGFDTEFAGSFECNDSDFSSRRCGGRRRGRLTSA